IKKMKKELATLPRTSPYPPKFLFGSNHSINLATNSTDLIVTSPPYKDKDVEYMLLQIQRPKLHKSKRSQVISKLLRVDQINKSILCGQRGEKYWQSIRPTLAECARVLKEDKMAFFWTGFRTISEREYFEALLEESGLAFLTRIPVQLSHDRVASSRSDHHRRKTGMMKGDFLFVTQKL
ncbi:MAG: DNA methyltransferase, partial [Promethearchaeota archaeon]